MSNPEETNQGSSSWIEDEIKRKGEKDALAATKKAQRELEYKQKLEEGYRSELLKILENVHAWELIDHVQEFWRGQGKVIDLSNAGINNSNLAEGVALVHRYPINEAVVKVERIVEHYTSYGEFGAHPSISTKYKPYLAAEGEQAYDWISISATRGLPLQYPPSVHVNLGFYDISADHKHYGGDLFSDTRNGRLGRRIVFMRDSIPHNACIEKDAPHGVNPQWKSSVKLDKYGLNNQVVSDAVLEVCGQQKEWHLMPWENREAATIKANTPYNLAIPPDTLNGLEYFNSGGVGIIQPNSYVALFGGK